jgi:F-type H+-transporting ATPase subunit epsilon
MSEKLTLEIVTPKGRALSESADEITAPGAEGEFGAMPGHVPMLVALRSGIVTYKQGQDTKRLAVGGGFAEIGPSQLTMLVDDCVVREAIDPVALRKEYQEAESAYTTLTAKDIIVGENDDERTAMIGKLNWLATQLELCGEAAPALIRLLEERAQSTEHVQEDGAPEGNA